MCAHVNPYRSLRTNDYESRNRRYHFLHYLHHLRPFSYVSSWAFQSSRVDFLLQIRDVFYPY